MFEAAHGAARDIAGKGIANPIALILSGAMLLEHLNELASAERVRRAAHREVAMSKNVTPDLGGCGSTRSLTDALCSAMQDG